MRIRCPNHQKVTAAAARAAERALAGAALEREEQRCGRFRRRLASAAHGLAVAGACDREFVALGRRAVALLRFDVRGTAPRGGVAAVAAVIAVAGWRAAAARAVTRGAPQRRAVPAAVLEQLAAAREAKRALAGQVARRSVAAAARIAIIRAVVVARRSVAAARIAIIRAVVLLVVLLQEHMCRPACECAHGGARDSAAGDRASGWLEAAKEEPGRSSPRVVDLLLLLLLLVLHTGGGCGDWRFRILRQRRLRLRLVDRRRK